jgi:predicted dehydrogenase
MATRTRWGILATGRIAATFVADLKLLDDAELVAVGSRNLDSAQQFADAHGVPRAYGSWAELAADPDLDVIYVATPHSAHYQATKLCLEAGKSVLCEKPFTLDLASAQELVRIAAQRKVFLMEAMWTRTFPAVRRMVELVAEGAIGEVTAVHADFSVAGPFAPTDRMRAPELGGGALLDLGVYPVAFAQLFLGSPQRVAALATLTPELVDENTGIILGYPNGALAVLHCGMVGAGETIATVVGTTGRIVVPDAFFKPSRFTLVRDGLSEEISMPHSGHGMNFEAAEVNRCLREGLTESPLVPLDQSLEVLRTLDAVRRQIGVSYER